MRALWHDSPTGHDLPPVWWGLTVALIAVLLTLLPRVVGAQGFISGVVR